MKLYIHPKCTTCKKAVKWLADNGIKHPEPIDIREQPPTLAELQKAAQQREIRKLFNTSGMQYRELGLKDKLATMSPEEAIGTLAGNGMLVKRPFLIDCKTVLVGFRQAEWEKHFLGS